MRRVQRGAQLAEPQPRRLGELRPEKRSIPGLDCWATRHVRAAAATRADAQAAGAQAKTPPHRHDLRSDVEREAQLLHVPLCSAARLPCEPTRQRMVMCVNV